MRWLYIACVLAIACSGAPPRDTPPSVQPRDAGTASDSGVIDSPSDAIVALVCEPFDAKNPACRDDARPCPEGHARCRCSEPPDVENPACWDVMACPKVPDKRVRACRPNFPTCTDYADPDNPKCPPAVVIVTARVIRAEIKAPGQTIITVAIGTSSAVSKHWPATVLRAGTTDPLPGGTLTILRMTADATVAEVALPIETVRQNPDVRFERP